MSKKNSSAILKKNFETNKELINTYTSFKKKIKSLKRNTFLVAVSGGPDSLSLTALINYYALENKCKIYYVLIDHNLRKNSSTEAKAVKKLFKKHGLSLTIIKNKKKILKNIQSEARDVRYNLLKSFCKKKKISIILTAHNLEDQVETFFIRLSRGSGLHGLSSMKHMNKIDKGIYLYRPLLDQRKNQLIKISKKIFGKYFKDPTNKDKKYLRTRVRNLKNFLETSGINYDQIYKSINNLASSRDTLDIYFNKFYQDIVIKEKSKFMINLKSLNSLNDEMKMRILKKSLKDFTKSYYSPRSEKIFNIINQFKSGKKTKLTLSGCLILQDKNHVTIKKENKGKLNR